MVFGVQGKALFIDCVIFLLIHFDQTFLIFFATKKNIETEV